MALADGETPESFASRLARLHNRPARLFCTDLGLTIQAIANGQPEALNRLEELARLTPGSLASFAFQLLPRSKYNLRGETLPKNAVRRERILYCPLCIEEDIARSSLPPIVAAHDRAIWKIWHIHTCHIHNIELIECGHAANLTRGDFASAIESSLPHLQELGAAAQRHPASSLEVYIVDRLTHRQKTHWIDHLDLYTLIKFSELAGALQTKGHDVAARTLSERDWQAAGAVGFDVLAQGPPGVEEFVTRMWASYPKVKIANQGAQAVLGILYQWLRRQTEGQRPLRELIYRHIGNTRPVGPGDEVLGIQVTERKIHSLHTASRQYDVHPKRLRKLLTLSGVLTAQHAPRTDHSCLFDATVNAPLLERIANSMSLKDAETYLGAGRVYAQLFYDHGFIKPFISGDEEGIGSHAFAKEDLDDFLSRLRHGAVAVKHFKPPVYPIASACRRANRSAAEVVAAILDGRLKWRGIRRGAKGFAAILVNLNEVRTLLADPMPDALPPSHVHKILVTSAPAVADLVREGFFKPIIVKNPHNRCPTRAIPRDQIEKFNEKYVSLYALARAAGRHPRLLKYELRDQGVKPAFDQKRVRAPFYRRCKIKYDL